MAFLTAEQEGRIAELLGQAEKWYDENNVAEYFTEPYDDPDGSMMYDGLDQLVAMIKIKKGEK